MAKKLTVIIVGIIVFVAAIYGAVEATSRPQFCANCHEQKASVASWKKGPHNQVNCLRCHADQGIFGVLKRKIGALNELYLHFSGKVPKTLRSKVNFQNCVLCHTGKIKGYPQAPNINTRKLAFGHKEILSQKISCLDCHREVAHGTLPSGQMKGK